MTSGPQVVPGYWGRPEESEHAIPGGALHTGDVGFMDADGWFYVVDRKKDQINAAGYKVWPREVEDVLYGHRAVREAAVVGVPDAYRGETVKAFVSLRPARRGGRRADRLLPRAHRRVQVPAPGRVRRRAAPDGQRQGPAAGSPRPLGSPPVHARRLRHHRDRRARPSWSASWRCSSCGRPSRPSRPCSRTTWATCRCPTARACSRSAAGRGRWRASRRAPGRRLRGGARPVVGVRRPRAPARRGHRQPLLRRRQRDGAPVRRRRVRRGRLPHGALAHPRRRRRRWPRRRG